MARIRRGLHSEPDKPNEGKPVQVSGYSSKYVTYDFPADLDQRELRKKIGFASIQGVSGYNCGNCKWFSDGRCSRWDIKVSERDCCSSWQK
jgi:hypothetical protein